MTTDEVEQPLVLYRDAESGTVRPALLPSNVHEDSEALCFRGTQFVRTGDGLVFWDYLVLGNGDIVGVVLNDFEVDASLASSRLLTASSNVTHDPYGYVVRLHCTEEEPDFDSSQAFGCSLFEHGDNCILLLADWHRRGYAFSLDTGLITPPA